MSRQAAPAPHDADEIFDDMKHPTGRRPPGHGLRLVKPGSASADHETVAINLQELTTDLLAGITAPGPVLRTYARRIARLMQRIDSYEHLIDHAPTAAGEGVDFLELQGKVAARRDGDDLALHRGLLALDALRDRRLLVTATSRRRSHRRCRRLANED